jgi:hypothetical protein
VDTGPARSHSVYNRSNIEHPVSLTLLVEIRPLLGPNSGVRAKIDSHAFHPAAKGGRLEICATCAAESGVDSHVDPPNLGRNVFRKRWQLYTPWHIHH